MKRRITRPAPHPATSAMNSGADMKARCARRVLAFTTFHSPAGMFSLHRSSSELVALWPRRRSAQLLLQLNEPGILRVRPDRVTAARRKSKHRFVAVERVAEHAPDP